MRGEFGKIVVLVAVALLLNAWLSHWYVDVVQAESVPSRTERQYAQWRERVDTLVLGDSHPKWGVAPELLERAFNLAMPGQTPDETYATLKREVEDSRAKVRRVVIGADATFLSGWQQDVWLFNFYYARFQDFLEVGWVRGDLLSHAVHGWLGRWAPWYGTRGRIVRFFEKGSPPDLPNSVHERMVLGGFLAERSWTDYPEEQWAALARGRARSHFPTDHLDEAAPYFFGRILALCRERRIGVVVVRSPVTPEYLRATRDLVDVEAIERRLAALLAPYPEVVRLDARRRFREHPEYFADPDHLNALGARRFTPEVRAALDSLPQRGGVRGA